MYLLIKYTLITCAIPIPHWTLPGHPTSPSTPSIPGHQVAGSLVAARFAKTVAVIAIVMLSWQVPLWRPAAIPITLRPDGLELVLSRGPRPLYIVDRAESSIDTGRWLERSPDMGRQGEIFSSVMLSFTYHGYSPHWMGCKFSLLTLRVLAGEVQPTWASRAKHCRSGVYLGCLECWSESHPFLIREL